MSAVKGITAKPAQTIESAATAVSTAEVTATQTASTNPPVPPATLTPPQKQTAQPPEPPPPQQQQQQQQQQTERDPKDLEAIKAAARAYALSGSTTNKKRTSRKSTKRLFPPQQPPLSARTMTTFPPRPYGSLPKVTQHRTTVPASARGLAAAAAAAPPPYPPYPPHAAAYPHHPQHPHHPPHMVPYGYGGYPPQPYQQQQQQHHHHPHQAQPQHQPPPQHHNPYPAEATAPRPPPSPPPPPLPPPKAPASPQLPSILDDDPNRGEYEKFVKSLLGNYVKFEPEEEDDADEFQLPEGDEDEDDNDDGEDDDDNEEVPSKESEPAARTTPLQKKASSTSLTLKDRDKEDKAKVNNDGEDEDEDEDEDDNASHTPNLKDMPEFDANFYQELAEELGWLEEEDMEAAVASLLDHPASQQAATHGGESAFADNAVAGEAAAGHGTPSRDTASPVSEAETNNNDNDNDNDNHDVASTPLRESYAGNTRCLEVSDAQYAQLGKLLNGHFQLLVQQAVLAGCAARSNLSNSRTLETADDLVEILDLSTSMLQDLEQNRRDAARRTCTTDQRLTRAQFSKSLQQQDQETVFSVKGLDQLKDIFSTIDKGPKEESNEKACRQVLEQSEAKYEQQWLPGGRDASLNFVDTVEVLGKDFKPPCDEVQEDQLRRNRNLFTSGEDNLVLRGVNLYGEKQWILLGDRFLPDRSVNIISQRYSKLCVMLYRANGIEIKDDGTLIAPPKLESLDDVDEEAAGKLKKVDPPAVLNVHRWSIEEDLTILKALPIFGTMWAEIAARYLPHRDRGHIRKRYLVLERRVKAAVSREKKAESTSSLTNHVPTPRRMCKSTVKLPVDSPIRSKPAPVPANQPDPRAYAPSFVHGHPYTHHHAPDPRAYSVGQPAPSAHQGYPLPAPTHHPQNGHPPHPSHPYVQPHHYHRYHPPPPVHPQPAAHHHPGPHKTYASPRQHQHQPHYPMSPPFRVMGRSLSAGTAMMQEEGSRAAFEQLVQDPKCTPSRPGRDDGDFSMLDSYRPPPSKPGKEKGLLPEVATQEEGNRAFDDGVTSELSKEEASQKASVEASKPSVPFPAKGSDETEAKLGIGSFLSPKEARKSIIQDGNSRECPPTPSTPFSSAFGGVFSPGNPLKLMGSPSMTLQTFPGGEVSNFASHLSENSNLVGDMGDTSNFAGSTLATGGQQGQDLKAMFEEGSSRHSTGLQIEGPKTPSPLKSSPSSAYSSNTPLFGEGATLMENDLDAISALNSLSSPQFLKRARGRKETSEEKNDNIGSTRASKANRSLFSKVIGSKDGSLGSAKKRKLQF